MILATGLPCGVYLSSGPARTPGMPLRPYRLEKQGIPCSRKRSQNQAAVITLREAGSQATVVQQQLFASGLGRNIFLTFPFIDQDFSTSTRVVFGKAFQSSRYVRAEYSWVATTLLDAI